LISSTFLISIFINYSILH